jgi:hypothetical protein
VGEEKRSKIKSRIRIRKRIKGQIQIRIRTAGVSRDPSYS